MKTNQQNCVFCKIANGEIPSMKVWENERFLAFMDIKPFSKGHLLVVPKNHSEWVWDMDDREYEELMRYSKNMANILRKAFKTEWVEEIIAGIGVQHSHIHLLPRQKNDGLGEIPRQPLEPRPSEKEMEQLAEKIRSTTEIVRRSVR